MAALHFRPGVDLREMTPQILVAWQVAAEIFERHGETCWVSSLYRKGTWDQVLLHGRGAAIDIGLRRAGGQLLPADVIDAIAAEITVRLGKAGGGQFDVVDERAAIGGPHLHLEFDPKA